MIAIVGLGNPGEQYMLTRHNAGFLVIDKLAERLTDKEWQHSNHFEGEYMLSNHDQEQVILLKPDTYVNESGQAVAGLWHYYRLPTENIWVIQDDTELPFGQARVKFAGTSGGHNGIKSIDQMMNEQYWRIRFGVGRPSHPGYDLADYVLGKFSESEQTHLHSSVDRLVDYLIESIEEGKLSSTTINLITNAQETTN